MPTFAGLVLVPLNGHWGRWADWGDCVLPCGDGGGVVNGYQTRSRMCDDPPPQFGGEVCQGVLVQVQRCKGKSPKCKKSRTRSRIR